MDILLTESQLKKIFKTDVDEAAGVPQGIVEIADQIQDVVDAKLIDYITYNLKSNGLTMPYGLKINFNIPLNFQLGGVDYDKVTVGITFDVNSNVDKLHRKAMGVAMSTKVSKDFKDTYYDQEKTFDLFYMLDVPRRNYPLGEIINDIKSEEIRNDLSSSLAHEIKHKFDAIKKQYNNIPDSVRYFSSNSVRRNPAFNQIAPFYRFLYYSYYSNQIEAMVRATEVYKMATNQNITRKEFVNFIKDNKVIKLLTDVKNFTYEKFMNELKEDNDDILLPIFIMHLRKTQIEIYKQYRDKFFKHLKLDLHSHLDDDAFEELYNREYKKLLDRALKKLNLNQEPEVYIKNEIKLMNSLADKTIRKIYKIVSLL